MAAAASPAGSGATFEAPPELPASGDAARLSDSRRSGVGANDCDPTASTRSVLSHDSKCITTGRFAPGMNGSTRPVLLHHEHLYSCIHLVSFRCAGNSPGPDHVEV